MKSCADRSSPFATSSRTVPVYLELFSLRPRFVLSRPSIFPSVMRRLEADLSKLVAVGLTPTEARARLLRAVRSTYGAS